MARNRVIYQSEALFVSNDAMSTGSGDHKQLERVQSANYGFNISREDVYCYGKLGKIGSMVLEAPTVSFDTSYLVTDGFNERALGFYVGTGTGDNSSDPVGDDPYIEKSFISGHISDLSGKNIYIATVPEGKDATIQITGSLDNLATPKQSVIGIGNAFLTDYTLDLSVGSLPTVSATFEAANIRSTDNVSGMLTPAVTITGGNQARENDEPIVLPSGNTGQSALVALRPGDISVSIASAQGDVIVDIDESDNESVHIQSASLSIPLSRSPLEKLGTKFAYARVVDFPIQATLSISAIVNELTAKNLATVIDQTATHTLDLSLKDTQGDTTTQAMHYRIKGAQLVSESFTSSIGSNKSVDLTFTTSIGGVDDTDNGVFVSGANKSGAF